MLHHISFPVADLDASARLYEAALAALGYREVARSHDFVGYGVEEGKDKFALKRVSPAANAGVGFHLAFAAPTRDSVDAFHAAALRLGATDNGAPGLRPQDGPTYYAAFVIDLDGHRIEAVHK